MYSNLRRDFLIFMGIIGIIFISSIISQFLIEKEVINNIDKFEQFDTCYQIKNIYYCK